MLLSLKSRLSADSRISPTCRGSFCNSPAKARQRGAALEQSGWAREYPRRFSLYSSAAALMWPSEEVRALKRVIPHAGHHDVLIAERCTAQSFEGFSLAV